MNTSSSGTYLLGNGPLHRLDARAKLCWLLAVTVAVFCAASAWVPALLLLLSLVAAKREGVPLRSLAGALGPALVILLLAFLSNALVVDGGGDIALWGPWGISWAGFGRGLHAVARILCLVAWSLTLACATSSQSLVDGFVAMARPLKHVGVSAAQAGMMLSLVLRFLPLCGTQIHKLRDAQRARGLDLDGGSVVTRLKSWVSVLIPVTVSLFARAQRTAQSMTGRCWGYKEPQVAPKPLGASGWGAIAGSAALVVLSIWLP